MDQLCSENLDASTDLNLVAGYQKILLFPQHKLIRRGMRGKDEQQLDVFLVMLGPT